MEVQRRHIALRVASALIVLILLIPTSIKLVHVFEHQDHSALCDKSQNANFHECEIDCDFLKYNLQHYNFKSQDYTINFNVINNFEIPRLTYDFFYNHRVLAFSLRGPPILV